MREERRDGRFSGKDEVARYKGVENRGSGGWCDGFYWHCHFQSLDEVYGGHGSSVNGGGDGKGRGRHGFGLITVMFLIFVIMQFWFNYQWWFWFYLCSFWFWFWFLGYHSMITLHVRMYRWYKFMSHFIRYPGETSQIKKLS